jgi:hypothetical protein
MIPSLQPVSNFRDEKSVQDRAEQFKDNFIYFYAELAPLEENDD